MTLFLLAASIVCADDASISHGPILGRVTEESIRVWARTSRPGSFVVRYGTDGLDRSTMPVRTSVAHDNTASVAVTGLEPHTTYRYQVVVEGADEGPGGTFRTLPSAELVRDPELNPKGLFNFRFEFACGNNQAPEHGNGPGLPTYNTLLRQVKDEVDFAILNGDWLYEDEREFPAASWQQQQQLADDQVPDVVRIAPTIAGVWENYKVYMSRGRNLMQWHRHVPSYFTFDDHEIVNDVAGCGTPGRRHRRTVFRDIGVRAWHDYLGWADPLAFHQPIYFGVGTFRQSSDVLTDSSADFTKIDFDQSANLHVHWGTQTAGVNDLQYDVDAEGHPNARVYAVSEVLGPHKLKLSQKAKASGKASYSIGRRSYGRFRVANSDFYLLDTRTHRQMHDVRHPDKPGLSMLGRHQTDWLIDNMKMSDADFFFVVSSVNFMIPHIGAGGFEFDASNKDDAWTVFLDEREELIKFWDSLGRPVFVLTGDLHNSFAIKITDRVWEFASGPHNSVNHRPSDEGDRPVTGRYQYGPRPCEIRWSSYVTPDIPRSERLFPMYCVVQVNNVFNNPKEVGGTRWVAYPQPQVIFQYFHGKTGALAYAEAISLTAQSNPVVRSWSRREQQ